LLVGSIVASLLTAVTLAVSARQAAAARLAAGQDGLSVPFVPAGRGRGRGADTAREAAAGTRDAEPARSGAGTVYGSQAPDEADGPGDTLVEEAPAAASPPSPSTPPPSTPPPSTPPLSTSPPSTPSPSRPPPSPSPPVVTIPSQGGPSEHETDGPVPTVTRAREPVPDAMGEVPEDVAEPASRQVEFELHPQDAADIVAGDLDDTAIDLPSVVSGAPQEDPIDEPPPQLVPAAESALIARLDTNVMVVDGRPRYHLVSCVHLLGREFEAVPVREAVELGFTPCSLCEPDTTLLEQARRI
jgi:hypothetical protein